MKKRKRIVLLALVVVVIGALVWVALREPPEPVYQGKKLSVWLRPYQAGAMFDHPQVIQMWDDKARNALVATRTTQVIPMREDSDKAVRAIGTNAIPFLLQRLRTTDSSLSRKLLQLAAKQRFLKIHYTPADYFQCEAIVAFGTLGADASNAVPELIKIYNQNISRESQVATIEALGNIGSGASQAVPFLLMELRNTNNAFVRLAVDSLGQIHAEPKAVVPALIDVLQHGDSSVKLSAACALGEFGAEARPALPLLIEYHKTHHGSPPSSRMDLVLEAIRKIDPDAASKAGAK